MLVVFCPQRSKRKWPRHQCPIQSLGTHFCFKKLVLTFHRHASDVLGDKLCEWTRYGAWSISDNGFDWHFAFVLDRHSMYHIERGFNANTMKSKCAAAIGWMAPNNAVIDSLNVPGTLKPLINKWQNWWKSSFENGPNNNGGPTL